MACFEPSCYWQDIGRMEDYERASADFAADPARFLGVSTHRCDSACHRWLRFYRPPSDREAGA